MASTNALTYRYNIDGHTIDITRNHVGTAYARNGNVANPTEYFTWTGTLDGEMVAGIGYTRAVAYEYARAKLLGFRYRYDEGVARRSENVRPFVEVRAEMKRNYVSRVTS